MLTANSRYNPHVRADDIAKFLYVARLSRAHFRNKNFRFGVYFLRGFTNPERSVVRKWRRHYPIFYRKHLFENVFDGSFTVTARYADSDKTR